MYALVSNKARLKEFLKETIPKLDDLKKMIDKINKERDEERAKKFGDKSNVKKPFPKKKTSERDRDVPTKEAAKKKSIKGGYLISEDEF